MISEDEFAIDALRHPQRTWLGFNDALYTLRLEEDDDGGTLFVIVEEIREIGEDVLVCSPDADEAVCWIAQQIEELENVR